MKQKNDIVLDNIEDYFINIDNDDDKMVAIKQIIFNNLPVEERNAILYYANCKSQRKLTEKLGVSIGLTNRYIKNIQNKIKNILKSKNYD